MSHLFRLLWNSRTLISAATIIAIAGTAFLSSAAPAQAHANTPLAATSISGTPSLTPTSEDAHASVNTQKDIPVGKDPYAVKINNALAKSYVSNMGDDKDKGTISVIDTNTQTVTTTIPIHQPVSNMALNFSTNILYVVSPKGTVTAIDGITDKIIGTIFLNGSDAEDIAVDEKNNKVYVSSWEEGSLTVIDGKTNTIIDTITDIGSYASGIAVDENTDKVYVLGGDPVTEAATVSVVDTRRNVVNEIIELGGTYGVGDIAIDKGYQRVYITNNVDDKIQIIDEHTNSIIKNIKLPDSPNKLVIDETTHIVYLTSGNDAVYAIRDLVVAGKILFKKWDGPNGIALDRTQKLYIANTRANTVTLLDTHEIIP